MLFGATACRGGETAFEKARGVLFDCFVPRCTAQLSTVCSSLAKGRPSLCLILLVLQHGGGITDIRRTAPRNETEQHERRVWMAAGARGVEPTSLPSCLASPFHARVELGRDAEVVLAVTGHYMLVFSKAGHRCFQISAVSRW